MGPRGFPHADNGSPPLSDPVPIPPRLPSLADQWRAYLAARDAPTTTVVDLRLPSGMAVRATRPSLLALLGAKRIPDALAGPVQELIALAAVAGADGTEAELNRRRAATPVEFEATFLRILDVVWLAAVVEPRFAEGADEADALPVSSVALEDKTYLFVWAQGVDQTVAEFLDRTARATAAVRTAPDRADVRPGPGGAPGRRPAG